MKLKIGDYVRWTSLVHGIIIKRKGRIVYIVDPFTSLIEILNDENFITDVGKNIHIIHNKLSDFRPYESYLVVVRQREGQILSLHWPDVNILKKIRKRKSKKKIINKEEKDKK